MVLKSALCLIAALLISLNMPDIAHSADQIRIATVDSVRVVEKSPQYTAEIEALQRNVNQRESVIREQQDEINKLQQEVDRNGPLMSAIDLQKRLDEIRIRKRNLKYAQDEFNEDLAIRRNEIRTRIFRQVREVIAQVAREQHIDLVVNEVGLVYTTSKVDISDQVIERLAKDFSQQ